MFFCIFLTFQNASNSVEPAASLDCATLASERDSYVYAVKQTENEEKIMARVEVNKQAPEFTAPDFNGNSVSLSNFTDRVNVLLIFNRSFS